MPQNIPKPNKSNMLNGLELSESENLETFVALSRSQLIRTLTLSI